MLYAFTVGGADVSLKTDEYGTRESELKSSRLTLVWLNVTALSVTTDLACAATAFLLWDMLIHLDEEVRIFYSISSGGLIAGHHQVEYIWRSEPYEHATIVRYLCVLLSQGAEQLG